MAARAWSSAPGRGTHRPSGETTRMVTIPCGKAWWGRREFLLQGIPELNREF